MLHGPWQISLFGGFAVRQRPGAEPLTTTNKVADLLAILADRVGRTLSRAELIEELWPDVDEEISRNRFRVLLSSARQQLESDESRQALTADRNSVLLVPEAFSIDADRFSRQIQMASLATTVEARREHYKLADDLYAGDFLHGRDGDWIAARRSHYARLQSITQFRFAALLEELGDFDGALHQVNRAILADPLREAPRRRAMRMLADSGEIGLALSQFEEYRLLLKRSVGLAPTDEFQEWIRGLKAGRRAKASDKQPPRKPDAGGVRIFLPPRSTSFVGRSADLAELTDLLPLYRRLTLAGPGGIGKTRLAIETARLNVEQFAAGVFYVPLGDIPKPFMILEAILQQIRLEPAADPLGSLRRYLAQPIESGRNACLFVFDGMDQLPAEASEVIARLLTELPNATVLTTARRATGTAGEFEYRVRPLEMPDSDTPPEKLAACPSVQLFVDRVRMASPKFAVTPANAAELISLCRRLDGVPLALELAAGQAATESTVTMLKKLGDLGSLSDPKSVREPRHRSLRASLEFTLSSLNAREQELFCSLCVFRGSFSAVAAAFLAGAGSDDLMRLVEHSLLSPVADSDLRRYTMLQMVREFGLSKLSTTNAAALSERHASYFRRLVADAELLHVGSGIEQIPTLAPDLENIRQAGNWTLESGDAESASKLALGMAGVWIYVGYQQEGRAYIDRIRQSLPLTELQEAYLNTAEGIVALFQEDAETGRERILKAIPVFEEADIHYQVRGARWALGYAAYLAGDFELALEYAELMDANLPPGRWVAYQHNLVGFASCELGRLDEAERILIESEQMWRDLGDLLYADFTHLNTARVAWKRGNLQDAWQRYLVVAGELGRWGNQRGLAYAVEGMGRVAADLGRFTDAARLLGAAQRLRESIGLSRDFADARVFEIAVDLTCEALGPAYTTEWQAGHSVVPDRALRWLEQFGSE